MKARAVAALLILSALILGPGLVLCARTPRGRVAGVFVLALDTLLVAGLVWLCAPLGSVEYALAAAGAVLAASGLMLAARHPREAGQGRVESHFLGGEPNTGTDLEDEYVWLLVQLATRCDPFMPAAEALTARARIGALLAAVATGADYRGLARVGGAWVRTLCRGALDLNHCYSYRPEPREPGERFGLLVFLHGHGTNYPFVVEALRPLCDRARLCLVAPSFGYGNWEAPGGAEVIARATRFGLAAFGADPGRVFLAGLSQGGAGVGRGGAAHPDLFAGLVFISPTMEPDVIGSPAFADGWRGRPVLVIQGERDRNVHPRTVDAAVAQMHAAGVTVTQHRDPGAGHFLFFAQLEEVTQVIADWVAKS